MGERIDKAMGRIEAENRLDRPSYLLGKLISLTLQLTGRPGKTAANALHGQPYGHPIHPLIVAIPIGGWTLALGLDLLAAAGVSRRDASRAADMALAGGSAGAVAAITTGLADWQHLNGRDRRVGLVHGTVNITALSLNLLSGALRRRDRRTAAVCVSAAAYAVMSVGGYLGGHLVYRRRAAVDHADRSPEPREFVTVAQLADLREKVPHRVAVWDDVAKAEIGIVLVRQGERVHAMGARCSHAGGPLEQGWVLEGRLVCPWHGSQYDLETGQPATGPSTCPQPRYEVRLRDGAVELRREQERGDHVVTSESIKRDPNAATIRKPARRTPSTGEGQSARTATEVLFEHHELIRRLFERMLATSGDGAERHELMRTLAGELDIHEVVEDAIFYPAIRMVSEDTDIAYAEHGVLADTLAATLKLPLGSPRFSEHLQALQAAFLHHAGSEEGSMFLEAERLADDRLREIGAELDARLDHERTSRFRQSFRALKVRLLESA